MRAANAPPSTSELRKPLEHAEQTQRGGAHGQRTESRMGERRQRGERGDHDTVGQQAG